MTLDLYKDFTKEEIKILVSGLRRGEANRKYYASLDAEGHKALCERNKNSWGKGKTPEELREIEVRRVESIRRFHRGLTYEEEVARARTSILSPESIENSKRARAGRTNEEKEKENERRSDSLRQYWSSITAEDDWERRRKISEGHVRFWANMTDEEREERVRGYQMPNLELAVERIGEILSDPVRRNKWIERSFLSKEAQEAHKKNWESLSEGKKAQRTKKALEGLKRSRAVQFPTKPELFLGLYLEEHFPGEWAYNGDGSCGGFIGGKVPDFIHRNGWRAVIEIFGCYWHGEEEVEEKIEHYKKYGFDCLVLWDYECYPCEDLGGKLTEFVKLKEV